MSRAYNGGSKKFEDKDVPESEEEVLDILRDFVREEFYHDEVADEIGEGYRDKEDYIIKMGNEGLGLSFARDEGEIVAYGTFVYKAKEHSVQRIWENKFEIRDTEDGVSVYVTDWYGTTPETWKIKVVQDSLYY